MSRVKNCKINKIMKASGKMKCTTSLIRGFEIAEVEVIRGISDKLSPGSQSPELDMFLSEKKDLLRGLSTLIYVKITKAAEKGLNKTSVESLTDDVSVNAYAVKCLRKEGYKASVYGEEFRISW